MASKSTSSLVFEWLCNHATNMSEFTYTDIYKDVKDEITTTKSSIGAALGVFVRKGAVKALYRKRQIGSIPITVYGEFSRAALNDHAWHSSHGGGKFGRKGHNAASILPIVGVAISKPPENASRATPSILTPPTDENASIAKSLRDFASMLSKHTLDWSLISDADLLTEIKSRIATQAQ